MHWLFSFPTGAYPIAGVVVLAAIPAVILEWSGPLGAGMAIGTLVVHIYTGLALLFSFPWLQAGIRARSQSSP